MKALLLITICVFLVSCDKSQEPLNPDLEGQSVDFRKVVILDNEYSGLVDLPKDTGGEHIAYPNTRGPEVSGFYAYTPGGYHDNTKEYPLILFLHGSGQSGDSYATPHFLDRVLDFGPPRLIKENRWNPSFPCLVISPQSEGDWSPGELHFFIKRLIEKYRINKKRIYITGLSMGGRGCWFYEGQKGGESFAAAIVPICGRGQLSSIKNLVDVPIWAFHGEQDTVVKPFTFGGSFVMVEKINENNPKFPAKLTMYPEVGHDSWIRTYDSSGMGTENSVYDPFDMSIYDWMFQYRKE